MMPRTDGDPKALEASEWLDKAVEDLESARVLIDTGHPANALFHCQQCAEKSLKAFLTWHGQPFRRTHDVEEVGVACCAIDPTLAPVTSRAGVLSGFAWRLRYPGEPYKPEAGETEAMWELAKAVLTEIRRRIPSEAEAG